MQEVSGRHCPFVSKVIAESATGSPFWRMVEIEQTSERTQARSEGKIGSNEVLDEAEAGAPAAALIVQWSL